MKPKIKIYFTDFWPVFEIEDNYFLNLLNNRYDVEICEENPDFLIYSVFGTQHYRYNCVKIFFTGENVRPDFSICDYSFSFDYPVTDKNYRLPLYPVFGDITQLIKPRRSPEEIFSEKTGFCNFIYSNAVPKKRIEFFKKLTKYKMVDSAGRVLNNVDFRVVNKQEFLSRYKFTIAFENEAYPGYTTEKIFEPMLADSIPIYWGNELVGNDFNSKSILSWHDYKSDEALIERIIEIDNNDELYFQYLKEPFFLDNKVNEYVNEDNILDRFDKIFSTPITPVAQTNKLANNPTILRNLKLKIADWGYYRKLYASKFRNLDFMKAKVKIQKFIGK